MILPFNKEDLSTQVIVKHDTPNGTFEVIAEPSWPCYSKDGAGKTMNLSIKMIFTDLHGNCYDMKLIEPILD